VKSLIVFLPCHGVCHFNLYKRSFVLRSLFDDAYCVTVGQCAAPEHQ